MYLIFDTETSDLPRFDKHCGDPCQPHICQIALLLLDKDFNEAGFFKTLIKPTNWIISSGAQAAHGISLDKCKAQGIDIKDAMRVFHGYSTLAQTKVCFNIKFDSFLVDSECYRLGAAPFNWSDGFCVMLQSTPICKIPHKNGRAGFKWPKLQEAYKFFFNEEFSDAHDAMADTRATARIFKHLCSLPSSSYST